MMLKQKLCAKRSRKASKRRKLKRWRRRLLHDLGPMLGEHYYKQARDKAAGRKTATQKANERLKTQAKPKKEVTREYNSAFPPKPVKRPGLLRRLFRRVVP